MTSTYLNQFDAFSKDELFEGLLGWGLFSDKLPPVFSSYQFFEFCFTNAPSYGHIQHSYARYQNIKHTGNTRTFGIPTPFTYYELCKEISESREEFRGLFRTNTAFDTHKVSRLHLRKMAKTNKLFEMNYENYKLDGSPRFDLLFQSKYVLKTDISQCFPTIYTHAIPWAFVGKETAKRDRGQHLFYNRLDRCACNMNYGETHGLLIGPHASNLLAETILTSVDKELVRLGCKHIRYIDDYWIFADSEQVAEEYLIHLDELLHQFGLNINRGKTSLLRLPLPEGEDWMRELLSYKLPKCPSKKQADCPGASTCRFFIDYKEINYFLDYIIRLIEKYESDTRIFKYAIRMISGYQLTEAAKSAYVLRLGALCKPFPYLVPLLQEFVFSPFNIAPTTIKTIIEDLYKWAVRYRYYEAASFCLYIALENNILISNVDCDFGSNSDCVFLVLLYLYAKKNALQSLVRKHKDYAKTFLGQTDEDKRQFQELWLYTYTVLNANELRGCDEWTQLKNKKVSFLRPLYLY